ncbi:hypothetical protein PL81_02890, partial [Streptomyces sp. RSD-27]
MRAAPQRPEGHGRRTGHTPAGTAYTLHQPEHVPPGEAPPVVLVAGAAGSGRIWEHHQVPALTSAGHRVVTFDHGPATGGPADLVERLRE